MDERHEIAEVGERVVIREVTCRPEDAHLKSLEHQIGIVISVLDNCVHVRVGDLVVRVNHGNYIKAPDEGLPQFTPRQSPHDRYHTGDGPLTRERLNEIVDAIQTRMPDHCGFIFIAIPWGITGEERHSASYASTGNRQDCINAMMDIATKLNDPDTPHA